MLETIALIAFFTIATIGIILAALGLPGTWLIIIGALAYNLLTWNWHISLLTFTILAGLAVLGEILEWILTFAVHKRSKTSKNAFVGLILGALIGAIALSVVPLIGTIVGLFIGALIGAYVGELIHHKNHAKAIRAAKAALLSRAAVMAVKLTLAIIQTGIALRAIST